MQLKLNLNVCKQKNWLDIEAQSVWGSCWLSEWNEACLSAAVHLWETVMRGIKTCAEFLSRLQISI